MLAKEIAELDDEIAKAQHDKAEAIHIRESEKGDFGKKHTDLSETIDALDRALVVLKKQDFDRAQAAALLQEAPAVAAAGCMLRCETAQIRKLPKLCWKILRARSPLYRYNCGIFYILAGGQ